MIANVVFPFYIFYAGTVGAMILAFLWMLIIEAFVYHKLLGITFKRGLWHSFLINIFSSVAGGFIGFFAAGLGVEWLMYNMGFMYNNLMDYAFWLPFTALATYLILFLLTVLIEWSSLNYAVNRHSTISKKKILKTILIANLLSYLVIATLDYQKRSSISASNVEDNISWVKSPSEKIFYLDENYYLCSILTDGTEKQLILNKPIGHYLFDQNETHFVFWNQSKSSISYFNTETQEVKHLWSPESTGEMFNKPYISANGYECDSNRIAISPNGQWLAWVTSEPMPRHHIENDSDRLKLYYYNTDSGNRYLYDLSGSSAEIAWSQDENVLYLKIEERHQSNNINQNIIHSIKKFEIQENNEIIQSNISKAEVSVSNNYGRFGYYSIYQDTKVYTNVGIICFVNNGEYNRIGDSDFMTPLHFGSFTNPTFLSENIILVEAKGGIYIFDRAKRKFGFLVDGKNYVMPVSSFSKQYWFGKS